MFYLGVAVGLILMLVVLMVAVNNSKKSARKTHNELKVYLGNRNDALYKQNEILQRGNDATTRQTEILIKIWQRLPKLEEDET
jgi:hypothetical protein